MVLSMRDKNQGTYRWYRGGGGGEGRPFGEDTYYLRPALVQKFAERKTSFTVELRDITIKKRTRLTS